MLQILLPSLLNGCKKAKTFNKYIFLKQISKMSYLKVHRKWCDLRISTARSEHYHDNHPGPLPTLCPSYHHRSFCLSCPPSDVSPTSLFLLQSLWSTNRRRGQSTRIPTPLQSAGLYDTDSVNSLQGSSSLQDHPHSLQLSPPPLQLLKTCSSLLRGESFIFPKALSASLSQWPWILYFWLWA